MRRSVAKWNAAFMRQNGVPEEICPARPAQGPLQAFSIVQLHRTVQPVEHEKTEGTEIPADGSESLMWSFHGSPSGESVLASLTVENSRPASVCSVTSCSLLNGYRFSLLACGGPFDDVSRIVSHIL